MGACWYDSSSPSFSGTFASRFDKPIADFKLPQINLDQTFPLEYWDPDLEALGLLNEFLKKNWESQITVNPPLCGDHTE